MVWSASSTAQTASAVYWGIARNSSSVPTAKAASHTSLNTRSTGESTIPSCPGRWPAAHRRNSSRRAAAPRNTRASPPYRGPLAAYPSHRVRQAAEFILDHHQFRLEHAVAQDGVALAVLRRYRSAGTVRGSHGGSPRFRLGSKVHLAAVDRQRPVVDTGD